MDNLTNIQDYRSYESNLSNCVTKAKNFLSQHTVQDVYIANNGRWSFMFQNPS